MDRLEEMLAELPEREPQGWELAAEDWGRQQAEGERRQEELRQAGELKDSIMQSLREGDPYPLVLHRALACIGLYADDGEYQRLGELYLGDPERLAAAGRVLELRQAEEGRRRDAEAAYKRRMRESVERCRKGYEAAHSVLMDALADTDRRLQELEREGVPEAWEFL